MNIHSMACFDRDDHSRVSCMVTSRIEAIDMLAGDMAAEDMVVLDMVAMDMVLEHNATVDKAVVAMTDMPVDKAVVDLADMVVDSIS